MNKEHGPNCPCSGSATQNSFDYEIHCDEEGRPNCFEVTEGPELFGGFGTPDQMVMSCFVTGVEYWEKGGRKNANRGDFYWSVGVAIGEDMYEYLSPEVKRIVNEAERKAKSPK